MQRIKLKNVKFYESMSEETNCFQADIYFDDKKIGECRNDGCGGNTNCYPLDISHKEKFAEAEQYCKSLPKIKYGAISGFEDFEFDSNLENVVDLLFENWLKEKENKKMEKNFEKGICFSKDSHSYQIATFKNGSAKLTIDEMLKTESGKEKLKQYCDAKKSEGFKILNTNLNF